MLMPVAALEAIGGFAAVRNLLAEDQAIGVRVRQAGYSIRLSHHVIDNVNSRRSFQWFLNRHSRWYKIRRQMALPAFLAEPAANLATVGLVWAFSGESGIAWGGLLVLVGLGMVRDAVQTRWLRGSFPKLRHLLYSPAKDILLLSVWFDAIFNRRVRWRGHSFLVGRMTRLRLARVPRQVRRASAVSGSSAISRLRSSAHDEPVDRVQSAFDEPVDRVQTRRRLSRRKDCRQIRLESCGSTSNHKRCSGCAGTMPRRPQDVFH